MGNLYVADGYANVVRKISVSGLISTIAGNGLWVYAGDGIPATNAQIQPAHIALDNNNNIYIGDKFNKMVFKVDTNNILYRVADNGAAGYSGDGGPATAASLDYPSGVSTDSCGNLYIAEATNKRIRKVTFHTSCTPPLTTSLPALNYIVSVYPNPAHNTLTITNAAPGSEVIIINMVGQQMLRQPLSAKETTIDIAHLPAGIYIIKVAGDGVQMITRVVKE